MKHFDFPATPVYCADLLSKEYGINLIFKRDDLFIHAGGGSKARKLQYILYNAYKQGFTAIVTTGDINSNHNRATALMGAKLGMKVTLVVHNDSPHLEQYSKNMQIARMTDPSVIYCNMESVGETMDKAMTQYKDTGEKPFYIWGGGHCLEGSYAYFDAVKEVINQFQNEIDYIYFPSGTGTTHAGIHAGCEHYLQNTKVRGISIARDKIRGVRIIDESVRELKQFLKETQLTDIKTKQKIEFYDEYTGGGYERNNKEINLIIKHVFNKEGVILDPTYTGKAFCGMVDHINKGIIKKNSTVLFWLTGGVYNFLSQQQ